MVSVYGCATKKDLKSKVGTSADRLFLETSMFGSEYKGQGSYCVVGPSPTNRKWYAIVKVDSQGLVEKVS